MPCALRLPHAKQLCGASSNGVTPGPATTPPRASDVKVADLSRLGLDEVLARPDLLAHKHREDRIGLGRVVDLGPKQCPRLGVHRRIPELVGVHLAEALEPLD